MAIDRNALYEYMKRHDITSKEKGMTANELADAIKADAQDMSWSLSAEFKRKSGTILRRCKVQDVPTIFDRAGSLRGNAYWIGVRSSTHGGASCIKGGYEKSASKKAKRVPDDVASSIGIYFAQQDGKDIMLTFDEARRLYAQLKTIFD